MCLGDCFHFSRELPHLNLKSYALAMYMYTTTAFASYVYNKVHNYKQ